MLKSGVGYSMELDEIKAGEETAQMALKQVSKPTFGLLYTGAENCSEYMITGIKNIIGDIPLIGCNSIGSIITNEGIIGENDKFCALMLLEDEDMKIGLASSTDQGNPRGIAHKLALEAMENAGMGCAPDYVYMIASASYEEDYVRGIEDVVGRVPLFGGGIENNSKNVIFTDVGTLKDGVAVAFIYTKKKIVTEYIGPYEETDYSGVITALKGKRTLLEIDGQPSLKKYAEWINENPDDLLTNNFEKIALEHPLGVKDTYGELTAIRHITSANADYSMNISNDLALNTAVTCMKKIPEKFVTFGKQTLINTREKLNNQVGAYLLIQSGSHRFETETEMQKLYQAMKESVNNVPFMLIFTNGEYGYTNHSANTCGELMLSFTGFSKE